MVLIPTSSQTAGPYFHLGLTNTRSVACMAGSQAQGERVWVHCRVLDGKGTPMNDAMLELWQADAAGNYAHPEDSRGTAGDTHCSGFGRLATNKNGVCNFETIKPGRVPGPNGVLQAPHINVSVFGRGILKRLATRIYFAGEAANGEDPILALVDEDRRGTLMAQPDPQHAGHWNFEIHLCGEDETVFFDV
jgi:protocatechuate 3,4-dioxygenase, alpha subunit